MAESESQKRANQRWRKRNRKKTRLYSDRAATKRYIKNETNKRYLIKMKNLIEQRLREL